MKATVILIMKEGKVLLARKVKKIGTGMWNGYGGKSEPSDESLRHTACRELYEESGMGIIVEPEDLTEVANIDFYYGENSIDRYKAQNDANFSVTFYIAYKWSGEASSTDEMTDPTWFALDDIPYDEMLPADRDFMPVIISNIRQVNTDNLETPITNGRVLFSLDMKSVVKSEYSR